MRRVSDAVEGRSTDQPERLHDGDGRLPLVVVGIPNYYPESLDRETWLHPLLMDDALGPDERSCVFVVVCDEGVDVGDEFGHASERCAFE